MAASWTAERRLRQAELIRTWKPWQQSTGPRTDEGKARAARNGFTGGHWLKLRELSREVNAKIREARHMAESVRQ